MTTCTGYIAYSGSDRINRPCAESATEIVIAGCTHEHIGEREFCTMHANEARSAVMLCGDCLDAKGTPHRCHLNAVVK